MNVRRRLVALTLLALAIVAAVGGGAVGSLYRVGVLQEGEALLGVASSQAHLLEAVFQQELVEWGQDTARAREATLEQVRAAQRRFRGFGRTGEFTLAERVGDTLRFHVGLREDTARVPEDIVLPSPLAIAVQRALMGEQGVAEALDYSGVLVVGAHAPVVGTPWVLSPRRTSRRSGRLTSGLPLLSESSA